MEPSLRDRFRVWLLGTNPPRASTPETKSQPLPPNTEGASKLAAGAFTTLSAVLTFIGVTNGSVQSMLRAYPRWALFVLCLIAVAALLGAVSPGLPNTPVHVRWFILLAALGAVGVLLLIPNLPSGRDDDINSSEADYLVIAVALVLLIGMFALWKVKLAASLLALCLAMGALGVGLYAAVKLVVKANSDRERVQLTPAVTDSGASTMVELAVKVRGLDDDDVLILLVEGTQTDGGMRKTVIRAVPGASGAIDETIKIPLTVEGLETVRVCANEPSGASVGEGGLGAVECDAAHGMTERAILSLSAGTPTTTSTPQAPTGPSLGDPTLPTTP